MDALADSGKISFKEYGKQKIYIARQDQFEIPNSEDPTRMKEENAKLLEQLTEQKRAVHEVEAGYLSWCCSWICNTNLYVCDPFMCCCCMDYGYRDGSWPWRPWNRTTSSLCFHCSLCIACNLIRKDLYSFLRKNVLTVAVFTTGWNFTLSQGNCPCDQLHCNLSMFFYRQNY